MSAGISGNSIEYSSVQPKQSQSTSNIHPSPASKCERLFAINIIFLINLTLLAGIIPLIERKYLSLIQRRVGPNFVGYKGRLQFIADALKLFLKGSYVPYNVNKVLFFLSPAIILSTCYLFWINVL